MSVRKSNRRAVRRARLTALALWGALLLAAVPAFAGDKPKRPRVFEETACAEVSLRGDRALVCQTERTSSVLVAWSVIEGIDGHRWVVGWTK